MDDAVVGTERLRGRLFHIWRSPWDQFLPLTHARQMFFSGRADRFAG
jgi:hypothetical protein